MAQSGFNRKQWTQSAGNYLVEKRGSDLVPVVHVGVGRMQSTWRRVGDQGEREWQRTREWCG